MEKQTPYDNTDYGTPEIMGAAYGNTYPGAETDIRPVVFGQEGEVLELNPDNFSNTADLSFVDSSCVDFANTLSCDEESAATSYYVSQEMLDSTNSGTEVMSMIELHGDGTLTSSDAESAAVGIAPLSSFVTITYGGNGHTHGTVPGSHNIPTPGVGRLQRGTMSRTNHTFIGWQTTAAPGSIFLPDVNINFSGSGVIHFTAVWQINNVTIRYNGNGHTGGTVPAAHTFLTPATVTPRPQGTMVRTGFVFTGWRLPDGRVLPPGGTLQFDATFGELLLTANWEFPDITMRFMGNGHTSGTAPATIVFRTPGSRALPGRNTLVRTNHTFVGWVDVFGYVSPPGTLIAEGTVINATAPMRGEITFFAGWHTNNAVIMHPRFDDEVVPHANLIVRWGARPGVRYEVSVTDITLSGQHAPIYTRAQGQVTQNNQGTLEGTFLIRTSRLMRGNRYRIDLHAISNNAFENINRRWFRVGTPSRIFIDPGHGGTDAGAVGNGMLEKDINLDVSLRLAQLLRAQGHVVEMSRTTDVDVSINARWLAANDWGADYFISVHTNSGGGTGVETIIATQSPNNPSRDLSRGGPNWRLASIVSNAMGNSLGMTIRRDNGVMLETQTPHGVVGVLRNTSMIAILPELGFIDSPSQNPDVDVLRNRRPELAQALANGVHVFLVDRH